MSGFRVKNNTMLHKVLKDPAREAAIQEEIAQGAQWIIDGPLRRVPPYYFTYLTFCKQRWLDRTLFDIFSKEFRDRPIDYYRRAIDSGLVLVNDKPANLETKLGSGDLLTHRTHKHEQPVSSRPVQIVFQDDELVVVDKPSGIPAHPTGRFKFNTVVSLLQADHGIHCHPCNRLDRLTSGLMFMAKNPKGADRIGKQIRDREVSKQYLALCVGKFNTEEVTVDLPIRTVAPKVTLNMVDHEEGKESVTKFQRVSYDPETNYSLVLCSPQTGRTHQIRIHLQHLGFPIANDPIYSSKDVWGPSLGKGVSYQSALADNQFQSLVDNLDAVGKTAYATSAAHPDAKGEMLSGEKCSICETELYTDPGPNDLDLWLHALRYRAPIHQWDYETALPEWATELHMPYMKLALDEARKAPDLPGAFAVGAALVHEGEVLATGYTRELEGNTHAEQNALTKLKEQGREIPEGTCLYTTMEPCTERLSGNLPCCDRVLQHPNIKTVFVGVMEPQDFIANNTSRQRLEDAGLTYIQIPGVAEEALKIAKKGH